jgi:hypothetical protein
VKNGANAISDAVAKTATVNAVNRIGTIDPAKRRSPPAARSGSPRSRTPTPRWTVYVLALRVS